MLRVETPDNCSNCVTKINIDHLLWEVKESVILVKYKNIYKLFFRVC